jgi:predicted negative regulator of RcsB-dependent stress response
MKLAEDAVNQGRLEAAEGSLNQALAGTQEPALQELIQIRLARVELQLGRNQEALARLEGLTASKYVGVVQELRGDLLRRLDRQDEARRAYADALAAMDSGAQLRFLVEMKLADIGGSPDAES